MWMVASISSKFLALSYFFDMAPRLFQKVESLTFQKMYGGICHLKWYRWTNFMDLAHGLIVISCQTQIQIFEVCVMETIASTTSTSTSGSLSIAKPTVVTLKNFEACEIRLNLFLLMDLSEGNQTGNMKDTNPWCMFEYSTSRNTGPFPCFNSEWQGVNSIPCLIGWLLYLA